MTRDRIALWIKVGAAFQDGHAACNDQCPFYRSISQDHPYGEGWATEHLCECTLGELPSQHPDMCPAVRDECADSLNPDLQEA